MASYQYVYHMDQVSKTYPGGKKVFENIRLNFLPGVKIGVVGVNGAGKSSLLRIMAGIDKDFQGEAWAAEVDVADEARPVERPEGLPRDVPGQRQDDERGEGRERDGTAPPVDAALRHQHCSHLLPAGRAGDVSGPCTPCRSAVPGAFRRPRLRLGLSRCACRRSLKAASFRT